MEETKTRMTRAEKRAQTEKRILDAARRSFAARGFDQTTVRIVAEAAEVDPGLVIHYFGSKEALFRQAVDGPAPEPITGTAGELTEKLLASLGERLVVEPATSLAVLRSMLTHPEATASVGAALGAQVQQLGEAIGTEDGELRAALVSTLILGVIVGRHLLDLEQLRTSSQEEIIALLRPSIAALTSVR